MCEPPPQQVMGRRVVARTEAVDLGAGEETSAYAVLRKHDLLESRYRLVSSAQIDAEPGNATPCGNLLYGICCIPLRACNCLHTFKVDAGQVRLVEDGRGNFSFYGPGVHRIVDPFYKVGTVHHFHKGSVRHGDLTLAVVKQGEIGLAMEKGHPVLLPPGLHQWRSATMAFEKAFSLNNNVIRMGPLTLVTVDSGYSAVTEDNGAQKILKGGATHLLTHRNWKFQKYVSEKIQTNDLRRIEATSADNVLMAVDSSVIWRITDVEKAALNALETIAKDGAESDGTAVDSILSLQNDVLKQAEASLAAFIGAVNYSDAFNIAAMVQRVGTVDDGPAAAAAPGGWRAQEALFDVGRMRSCLAHANAVTATYGVTILSINVVSAVPVDKSLQLDLAAGAVAAAEAQKFEKVAIGTAAARKIEAAGSAEADVLRAKGLAEAARIRAEGHTAAADKLIGNQIAVQLATIEKVGEAIGSNKVFVFGTERGEGDSLGSLVVSGAKGSGAKGGNWFG